MRKPSRQTTLAAMLVLLIFAALTTVTSANHSWNGYHWARTSNPFTLQVGDNVNSVWDTYLDEAISDWSASSVLNLTKVTGGTRPRQCRPTSGRIEACNASYGSTGWLGIAQIWASGSHITQALTKVNDTYFDTAQYNTPAWRRLVMCQEIAHDFGLDHQDENFSNPNLGSCMDYTNDPDGGGAYGPSNEHPNKHDFDQLISIYGHGDSTGTVGQTVFGHKDAAGETPPAMNDIDLEGPRQWGRLIRSSPQGRVQLYELDFGNGHKVFTHVLWAFGEERGRGNH
ncbi:MAG: hypothetical protein H0U18_12615 [Pyrinomonadaceae bacterium]|nr:hypothetical protein [Pyrinomonadaceae bacterium]